MFQKSLKCSAIYRTTNDNIENFQIQITLKTINSLLKVDKFELKTPRHKDSSQQQNDDIDDRIDIITIKWQEKILSRYEIEFYKDLENCSTDVHKNYHNLILRDGLADDDNNEARNIFTYVDDDSFSPNDDLIIFNGNDNGLHAQSISTSKNSKKNILFESKVMYIYADLHPDTQLFKIYWLSSEKILIVYPDFNEFNRNPYFIEIDSDYRHLYSYAIKNISICDDISFENRTGWLATSEIPSSLTLMQQNQTNTGLLDMPPKKMIRFSIILNIKEAESFEYDSLHVRYKIKLPNKMKIEMNNSSCSIDRNSNNDFESPLLKGSTHSSTSSCSNNNSGGKIWNFGYSIQLNILCIDEDFIFHQNLKIYFEIISIDSWQRERNEGYSNLTICLKPGKEQYELNCFRLDFGLIDRIGRWFIGGRTVFDEEAFNGSEGFLNRYRSRTISTGILRLESQCILQKNIELMPKDHGEKKSRKKASGMTLDDIMKAYHEARKRLEATTLNN